MNLLLTEEDVIRANLALVFRESRYGYRGLDLQERVAAALYGLLYAVRTFPEGMSGFQEYAVLWIRRFLKKENREAWRQRRGHSLYSLDRSYGPCSEDGDTLSNAIGWRRFDETKLEVAFFLDKLPLLWRRVVLLRMKDYTDAEVCVLLRLSRRKLRLIYTCLRQQWRAYEAEGTNVTA